MTSLVDERTNQMLFAIKLGIKVAKSKTGRKIAKKAAKTVVENVDIAIANRGLDVTVAGKTFRVDRSTLTRTSNETAEIATTANNFDDVIW